MKKNKPKDRVVKELASQFEVELNKALPISVQANGSIVYKDHYIKSKPNGNWGLYSLHSRDLIDEFHLKTCALMAAKYYMSVNLEKFNEVKRLDVRYWSSHSDTLVYKKNMKTAKDLDRYIILLYRLELSEVLKEQYQAEISRMFKWSFV